MFGYVRDWELQDKISRGFLKSIGVCKEINSKLSKMLKPKMRNPKLQTCHQFTLPE